MSSPRPKRAHGQQQVMPAEWSPHAATLLLYPHNPCVFRSAPINGNTNSNNGGVSEGADISNLSDVSSGAMSRETICAPARREVRNVSRAIASCGEHVLLYCNTEQDAADLKDVLEKEAKALSKDDNNDKVGGENEKQQEQGEIIVLVCPSDDSWIRDTGPTFVHCLETHNGSGNSNNDDDASPGVIQNELIGLDWDFNAYGGPNDGCYWPCDLDRAVASKVVASLSSLPSPSLWSKDAVLNHRKVDLILEGGSIHVDGQGTLITTEECLLNTNRNPARTKNEIEDILCHELGCTKIIWLPYGLDHDDDTNGHVDNFCCFARPGELVLAWTDDEKDDGENYRRCRLAEEVLRTEVDAMGRTLIINKLYLPRPLSYTPEEVQALQADDSTVPRKVGERLSASYVNFYICNGGIVLPQFGDTERDAEAVDTIKRIFPDRRILLVFSREILLGGGNIHCITQQVPISN